MPTTKKTLQTQPLPVPEIDEFDSPEFESQASSLPYLQILNDKEAERCGFFITSENMEAVNFIPTEEWNLHTTTFQNGESVEGYRSLVARFLILQKSALLTFNRESGDFLGVYNKTQYDRDTMVLKVRYLVYLVSQQKQLLHEKPLMFTTKGSVSGSFGEATKNFRQDLNRAYKAATGATRDRGDRFFALSVLAVRLKPALKGDKKKSWVCDVDSYGSPTPENWKSYFVGYDQALKEKILAEVDEWREFAVLSQNSHVPAPPTSDDSQELEETDF